MSIYLGGCSHCQEPYGLSFTRRCSAVDREDQIIREYLGKIEALRQREDTVRQLAWKVVLSKGEPEEMERLKIFLRETE